MKDINRQKMERALIVIVCSAVMVAVLHGCFLNKRIYRCLFSVFYPYPSYSSVSSPLRTE